MHRSNHLIKYTCRLISGSDIKSADNGLTRSSAHLKSAHSQINYLLLEPLPVVEPPPAPPVGEV